jgi:ornithine cyclodeaminase
MKIYHRHQILEFHDMHSLMERIEKGFVAYSQNKVNMPAVSHMHFEKPLGDVHIKCASIQEEDFYVVKIASCFPENFKLDQPSLKGLMFLFKQESGEPEALFLDEGYLTHLRTAVAGAISAKYLGPRNPQAIGILGAGVQAKYQLKLLKHVTSCREVWVWDSKRKAQEQYQQDDELKDFNIHIASGAHEVAEHCRLIVTATPATQPILFAQDVSKGTHITAVGSDRPGKQELDPALLKFADRLVVDSRLQCLNYGEMFCALSEGMISEDKIVEIGEIIAGLKSGRINENEITIADLTGLGVQDLEIALGFYNALNKDLI